MSDSMKFPFAAALIVFVALAAGFVALLYSDMLAYGMCIVAGFLAAYLCMNDDRSTRSYIILGAGLSVVAILVAGGSSLLFIRNFTNL